MNTRLPTAAMSQISPLGMLGVSARGVSGTSRVWPGTGCPAAVAAAACAGADGTTTSSTAPSSRARPAARGDRGPDHDHDPAPVSDHDPRIVPTDIAAPQFGLHWGGTLTVGGGSCSRDRNCRGLWSRSVAGADRATPDHTGTSGEGRPAP